MGACVCWYCLLWVAGANGGWRGLVHARKGSLAGHSLPPTAPGTAPLLSSLCPLIPPLACLPSSPLPSLPSPQKPRVKVSLAAVYSFMLIGWPLIIYFTGLDGWFKFWLMPWLGYHFWMSECRLPACCLLLPAAAYCCLLLPTDACCLLLPAECGWPCPHVTLVAVLLVCYDSVWGLPLPVGT